MWENLRTIVISSVMTVIILASAIWMGIIPTQQQVENTYQLRQTIQETFIITGKDNQQTFTYPIKNITEDAVARTLKVYAEFNAINNPKNSLVSVELHLFDTKSLGKISEIESYPDKIFGSTSMNFNLNPKRAYSLCIMVHGANVTGNIQGTIIQEIIRT